MLTLTDAMSIQGNYHSTRATLTDEQARLIFAVLEEPFPETHPKCLFDLIRAYIRKVEVEGATQRYPMLARDFNAKQLLYWAASIGWPMKRDFKERLAILSGDGEQNQQRSTPPETNREKGYKKLTPGATRLREILYSERKKEIERAETKQIKKKGEKGVGKGKYRAECWETWIPKFKKRIDVKELLQEEFNLKLDGKTYTQVAGNDLSPKNWENIYNRAVQKTDKK